MIKVLTTKIHADGCSWYRTRQPLTQASELDLLTFKELDTDNQTEKEIYELIKVADVYYLRFSFVGAASFIKMAKESYPKKPIIFDTDDDYFNVNPLNDFYATVGTKEVLADGKPLWVEGNKFDPYANRKLMIDYEYCISHATVVTTTTEKLAQELRNFNDNVVVFPNSIDPLRFPKIKVEHDDLRLLWHGGSSHYPDLVTVKSDLERLMSDYPTLNLYIYGQVFKGLFKNIDEKRLRFQGWIGADGHGFRLATIGADVAICPLVNSPFNENKSSIKFYESAALGIPTVAKNILPYSADIKNGRTGFLYDNDLYDQVKKLLDDKNLRNNISKQGYEWVIENRNLKTIGKNFGEFINKIVQATSGFEIKESNPIKRFSIVIPTHNRLNLAKQTLESLKKNTPRDLYELIVVDDDSTDGTREWLKTQDIDVLIENDSHSCGASKNKGVLATTCEYIYISDADMYFGEGWYKDLIKVYPRISEMILGCVGHPYWETIKTFKDGNIEIHITEQQPGNSWMITKDIWNKCGPLLEGVGAGVDDTEFCNRAKKLGIYVGHLNSSVYHCGLKRADGTPTYGADLQIKDLPKGVITE